MATQNLLRNQRLVDGHEAWPGGVPRILALQIFNDLIGSKGDQFCIVFSEDIISVIRICSQSNQCNQYMTRFYHFWQLVGWRSCSSYVIHLAPILARKYLQRRDLLDTMALALFCSQYINRLRKPSYFVLTQRLFRRVPSSCLGL